jgi:homogentisate solanesyltransferase
MQDHDAACLFKIIQCEQNCQKRLLRRDMDRHCVTVCAMRPMKCPFGCDSSFPETNLGEHCSESLQLHLLKVLQAIHKKGFTADELKDRALQLEKVRLFILQFIRCSISFFLLPSYSRL